MKVDNKEKSYQLMLLWFLAFCNTFAFIVQFVLEMNLYGFVSWKIEEWNESRQWMKIIIIN